MISKILTVASIVAVSNAQKKYIASFSNNGVSGSVTVDNGQVMVDIDLSAMPSLSLPTNFSFCTNGGMSYHIHQIWQYGSSDTTDRMGTTDCNGTYTSGHYDPWNACGGASGSSYCNKTGGANRCIPVSAYSPDYDSNPFSAEVGDWSNKYSSLQLTSANKLTDTKASFYEVLPGELSGKSVVFHCNNGQRAFCAPFVESSDDTTQTVPAQDATKTVVAEFGVLSDESMIVLHPNGSAYVNLDAMSIYTSEAEEGCSSYEYSIFEAGSSTLTESVLREDCSNGVGAQYDPTNQCLPWSPSSYCTSGKLCGDSGYLYNCDFVNDRYSCAPGDLSGKIGLFTSPKTAVFTKTESSAQTLIPPTDLLIGKVIAINCAYSDSSTIKYLACAPIEEYHEHSHNGVAQISFGIALFVSFIAILY